MSNQSNNNQSNTNTVHVTSFNSFEEMGLRKEILQGIFGNGFEKPSRIQKIGIVPIMQGHDIIAQSQSGTGKTGSFIIAALSKVDESIKKPQIIVMSPTRELAQQTYNVCKNIGVRTGIVPVLCIGGTRIDEAKKQMRNKPSIAIGTPGRIIDMIQKRIIPADNIKMLIVDEADEMFSTSFIEQLKQIVQVLASDTQICLFSATLPEQVLEIADQVMNNPIQLLMNKEELTLDGISQYYVNVGEERYKSDVICDLYNKINVNQSIIYANSVNRVIELQNILLQNDFTISIIHGKMESDERRTIMNDFRSGKTRILISTDLLARGIDVQQVSTIINYDMPNNLECYIHRIGRSGRFGKKGVAINIITAKSQWTIAKLEEFYATSITPLPEDISKILK